jgi:hypothetical protein
MSSTLALRIDQLKNAGFNIKIADGGIIAYLRSRTLGRQELIREVPELESSQIESVEEGMLISFGER